MIFIWFIVCCVPDLSLYLTAIRSLISNLVLNFPSEHLSELVGNLFSFLNTVKVFVLQGFDEDWAIKRIDVVTTINIAMEAPPTYDEAVAGKLAQNGAGDGGAPNKTYTQYRPVVDLNARSNYGPPPPPISPAFAHGYQDPQVVTVTMIPAPTTTRTVVVERYSSVNHCLHCCITLLFWPWIFVWIFLCLVSDWTSRTLLETVTRSRGFIILEILWPLSTIILQSKDFIYTVYQTLLSHLFIPTTRLSLKDNITRKRLGESETVTPGFMLLMTLVCHRANSRADIVIACSKLKSPVLLYRTIDNCFISTVT